MHPMKAGIAHGVTGGVRSRLSGGSFKSGFLGLAVSYGASWSGAYEAAGVSRIKKRVASPISPISHLCHYWSGAYEAAGVSSPKPTHGHKGHKMLSLLMWLEGLLLSWVAVSLLMVG
jgi:hypothetical protein